MSEPGVGGRRPTDRDPVAMTGVLLAVLTLAVIVAGTAIAAWYWGKSSAPKAAAAPAATEPTPTPRSFPKVSPNVAAGAHDFVRFACVQCHGDRGQGGVSPDVPALTTVGKEFTVAQLTTIIEHGIGASGNPTKPYMPVWHGIISPRQISEIVDYLHAGLPAVKDAEPLEVPTDQGAAAAGSILYVNFGCVNCHGPNGLGGVPNPQSPDKTVPPLATPDFFSEFNTPKKIRDVIISGSVIGKAPIVSMPHWGSILTSTQVDQLIAYIDTLRTQ
jgi:mono/diheme cytochrome c family protein